MFYHIPRKSENSLRIELQFFKELKRNKRAVVDQLQRSVPRMLSFEPEDTVMDMKRKIYDLVKGCYNE